jgi:hypothetical protein
MLFIELQSARLAYMITDIAMLGFRRSFLVGVWQLPSFWTRL